MLNKISSNFLGWNTKRKIVVFESDDWGSIRMPDAATRDYLEGINIPVKSNYFSCNDSLESEKDMIDLISLLKSFKNANGQHPVFTTLNILANPDFDKIKDNGFAKYEFQHFSETYEYYGVDSIKMKKIWNSGYESNVLFPSFHGREHLSVSRWMNGLRSNLPVTKLNFNLRLTGIHADIAGENRKEYQAAFDIDSPQDIEDINQILSEGLRMFKDYFGYSSRYFVPTNGFLNPATHSGLYDNEVRYLNTPRFGKYPIGNDKYKRYFRFAGLKSKENLTYLTRNVFFEPSDSKRNINWVEKCISDMEAAFYWNKPVVISTHRVNYTSRIDSENQNRGLQQLSNLIQRILRKWPNVEFMNSCQLGDLIVDDSSL